MLDHEVGEVGCLISDANWAAMHVSVAQRRVRSAFHVRDEDREGEEKGSCRHGEWTYREAD